MTTVETRKKNLGKRILQNKWVYLFLLPGIAYLILFSYVPMYGLTLAFKDFKISAGIFGSPWSDPLYKNFAKMFDQPDFWRAFFNTFRMGFWYILTGFPMPIILAMLLNYTAEDASAGGSKEYITNQRAFQKFFILEGLDIFLEGNPNTSDYVINDLFKTNMERWDTNPNYTPTNYDINY